jgi:hypothetical protein
MEEEGPYPFTWEVVDAARQNNALQRRHSKTQAKEAYATLAVPCPGCDAPADRQAWIYVEMSGGPPPWLAYEAGWVTVCDPCHLRVNFFCEVLS